MMQIQNQYLKAAFQSRGAELTSLIHRATGQEYIWQAHPAHWGRHTPVLFPFVGRLKNDLFTHRGKTYSMGQHGFARDMHFVVERHTDASIIFLLKSTPETLAMFPFPFELRLEYQLEEQSLVTRYQVSNTATEEMYFSIGGHPAFKCPMTLAGSRSDYYLMFNKEEDTKAWLLEDGNFTGEQGMALKGQKLPITQDLFDQDALVFKNLNSTNVSLWSADKCWLTFHYQGFPYLGIWSKNQVSPFVCIEPWFGLADHKEHDGDITGKEGILKLERGENFTCDYRISIV